MLGESLTEQAQWFLLRFYIAVDGQTGKETAFDGILAELGLPTTVIHDLKSRGLIRAKSLTDVELTPAGADFVQELAGGE